jgi:hypothetical protein
MSYAMELFLGALVVLTACSDGSGGKAPESITITGSVTVFSNPGYNDVSNGDTGCLPDPQLSEVQVRPGD